MFRWIFRVMATGPRAGGWQEMQVPATSAQEAEDIVKRSTGATGAKSLGHLGPYVSQNDLRDSAGFQHGQVCKTQLQNFVTVVWDFPAMRTSLE